MSFGEILSTAANPGLLRSGDVLGLEKTYKKIQNPWNLWWEIVAVLLWHMDTATKPGAISAGQ